MNYYANRIGVIKRSNNVVLYTDNGFHKSGRYVVIDRDNEDEYIKRNTSQTRKNKAVSYLSTAAAIGIGILTYAKVKTGHVGKSLAAMATTAAGFIGAYHLTDKYERSTTKKIDRECNVKPVRLETLLLNNNFKELKKPEKLTENFS